MPLIESIKTHILAPVVAALFALAMLGFLYGLVQYLRSSESSDGRAKGAQHMLWGIVGLAIMVSVYGIMNVVCKTIGCA